MPPAKPHRRTRQPIACDPCRSSKRKCSGGLPCESCVRRGKNVTCVYDATSEFKIMQRIEGKTAGKSGRKRQRGKRSGQGSLRTMMLNASAQVPKDPRSSGVLQTALAHHLDATGGEPQYTHQYYQHQHQHPHHHLLGTDSPHQDPQQHLARMTHSRSSDSLLNAPPPLHYGNIFMLRRHSDQSLPSTAMSQDTQQQQQQQQASDAEDEDGYMETSPWPYVDSALGRQPWTTRKGLPLPRELTPRLNQRALDSSPDSLPSVSLSRASVPDSMSSSDVKLPALLTLKTKLKSLGLPDGQNGDEGEAPQSPQHSLRDAPFLRHLSSYNLHEREKTFGMPASEYYHPLKNSLGLFPAAQPPRFNHDGRMSGCTLGQLALTRPFQPTMSMRLHGGTTPSMPIAPGLPEWIRPLPYSRPGLTGQLNKIQCYETKLLDTSNRMSCSSKSERLRAPEDIEGPAGRDQSTAAAVSLVSLSEKPTTSLSAARMQSDLRPTRSADGVLESSAV